VFLEPLRQLAQCILPLPLALSVRPSEQKTDAAERKVLSWPGTHSDPRQGVAKILALACAAKMIALGGGSSHQAVGLPHRSRRRHSLTSHHKTRGWEVRSPGIGCTLRQAEKS
jgi:hypothetical protein